MREPRWISAALARAIHLELISEHGGLPGVRDYNLLESALARPPQIFAHRRTGLAELAAAYAFETARNGNKRMALAVLDVFLRLNGHELTASEPEAASTIYRLAEGSLSEQDLARWTARHSRRR